MESEVLKIKHELDRLTKNTDNKRAIELFKSLESIPMTYDVLHNTHLGLSINQLRKASKDPEVITLAKSLIRKWRKTLDIRKGASSSNSANNHNNNNSSGKNGVTDNSSNTSASHGNSSSFASPNSNSNESYSIQSVGNSQQADQPTPSGSNRIKPTFIQREVPPTNSEVRLKARQLITEALRKPLPKELSHETFLDEENLAGYIEESIFQEFKATDTKYRNRFRSRVANLGDVKNPFLRFNVLRGDIAPEKIAKMTAEEMASDELKKQRELYTKEAINDHQMALTGGTKTSDIKCPACKKYNVSYNQVQTRSADEPMTTFCYCNECGKRWKFC